MSSYKLSAARQKYIDTQLPRDMRSVMTSDGHTRETLLKCMHVYGPLQAASAWKDQCVRECGILNSRCQKDCRKVFVQETDKFFQK